MALRVTSLASGSTGNAMLFQADGTNVLVDAGLPTPALEKALQQVGVAPSALDAVFLTHEHVDHVAAAGVLSRRYGVPLIANAPTLKAAPLGKVLAEVMPTGGQLRVGPLHIHSFALPHDGSEPVGYWMAHDRWRICLMTDLGHVPDAVAEYIRSADLVILEANHDVSLLLGGPYPEHLKTRILSNFGHLSNEQAAQGMLKGATVGPQWLWLAHLSAINNSPRHALKVVRGYLEREGLTTVQVQVALRDRRSLVWDSSRCWVQPKLL